MFVTKRYLWNKEILKSRIIIIIVIIIIIINAVSIKKTFLVLYV